MPSDTFKFVFYFKRNISRQTNSFFPLPYHRWMIFFHLEQWKCWSNVSFSFLGKSFLIHCFFSPAVCFRWHFLFLSHSFSFSLATLSFLQRCLFAEISIEWSEDLQVTNNDSAFKRPIAFSSLHPLLFFVKCRNNSSFLVEKLFVVFHFVFARFAVLVSVPHCLTNYPRSNNETNGVLLFGLFSFSLSFFGVDGYDSMSTHTERHFGVTILNDEALAPSPFILPSFSFGICGIHVRFRVDGFTMLIDWARLLKYFDGGAMLNGKIGTCMYGTNLFYHSVNCWKWYWLICHQWAYWFVPFLLNVTRTAFLLCHSFIIGNFFRQRITLWRLSVLNAIGWQVTSG